MRDSVHIEAGAHIIRPSKTERLLGVQVAEDLMWKEHIIDNNNSLVKQLNSRINGMCLIAKRANFKDRLMIANGIYMSKLCNLIQLWGGTNDYLLRALQLTQNRICRIITRKSWFTPTRVLLRECNWLSVHQLVEYHTLLSAHKIVTNKRPQYLHSKMCQYHSYNTRNTVLFGDNFTAKSALAAKSFCYRATVAYNKSKGLKADLRKQEKFIGQQA